MTIIIHQTTVSKFSQLLTLLFEISSAVQFHFETLKLPHTHRMLNFRDRLVRGTRYRACSRHPENCAPSEFDCHRSGDQITIIQAANRLHLICALGAGGHHPMHLTVWCAIAVIQKQVVLGSLMTHSG